MNSIPDDELLSAYLDGELSDDERARVEQMLAEQPEARQLLDELRTLGSSFEGLPRHRLEADFAARVLRAAEREMLSGETDGEVQHSVATAPPAADRPVVRLDWMRWRRPIVWAGFALAAGLLLMVVDRGRPPAALREPVAHAPGAGAEFRAPEEAAEPPAAEEKSGLARAERAADRRLREHEAAERPPSEPAQPRRRFAAPAKAPANPEAALEAGAMRGEGRLGAKRGAEDFAKDRRGNYFSYFQVATQQNGRTVAEPLDPQTLVIWCEVDQNVPARPEFRELLTSNGIVWDADANFADADAKLPAFEKAEALQENASDYVLLEATEEQLKAVLTEFDRHPELFLTVNVEPSPAAPSQQAFEVYNRARVSAKGKSGAHSDKTLTPPMPKLKARISADGRQAGKQAARLGRAQQVLVLPQQVQLLDESSPPAKEADAAGEEAKPAESLGVKAGERLDRARAKGGESQTAGNAAAQKPRSLAQAAKSPADAAQEDSAQGYQQALIIFRRVPAPAAAAAPAPAEAAEKQPD
ncbi:MAG TPA: zf-HC2 domain-containing protein [Pirellulales bacterium]|nr:zf-HC2 domain-containing protein [Pirellulales bacterium]